MICRDRRIIFIHVTKTGGASIEDLLWPRPRKEENLWMGFVRPGFNKYQSGGLQHLTVQQVRQEVGDDVFASCYIFALVRHPVDRLVSQFNFLNRRPDLLELLDLDGSRTFATYLDRIQQVDHVQWKPQHEFLVDDAFRIVPEVFRLEDLSRDFSRLSGKIGVTVKTLPHSNRSIPAEVPQDWVTLHKAQLAAQEIDCIERLYKTDFDLLGYSG